MQPRQRQRIIAGKCRNVRLAGNRIADVIDTQWHCRRTDGYMRLICRLCINVYVRRSVGV
jgi:hypothetical protein